MGQRSFFQISIYRERKNDTGQKMIGATGGIQGAKGTLFGVPYAPGSWQDQLIEAFAGPHDYIGGSLTGLYDEQGNIKRGMTDAERATYDKLITTSAIPVSAPFAIAGSLPPDVWQAISILLGTAR
jgi:filamentous hemagglutinin